MVESRYEKYVVRKPAVFGPGFQQEVPDKVDIKGKVDTGPLIWVSRKLIEGSAVGIESGIIKGDIIVGAGGDGKLEPHIHEDFDELFLFLGTNFEDIHDLGAEAEFWLGEGDRLDKVEINTSACVYIPAGLAHFPIVWKNVKRPCIFFVVVCTGFDPVNYKQIPVSTEGRPQ
jgi:uncharacterized RmlC-like cupin family protein